MWCVDLETAPAMTRIVRNKNLDELSDRKCVLPSIPHWTLLGDGNKTSRVGLLRLYQITLRFRYRHLVEQLQL